MSYARKPRSPPVAIHQIADHCKELFDRLSLTQEAIHIAQMFRRSARVNQDWDMRLDLLDLLGKLGARRH